MKPETHAMLSQGLSMAYKSVGYLQEAVGRLRVEGTSEELNLYEKVLNYLHDSMVKHTMDYSGETYKQAMDTLDRHLSDMRAREFAGKKVAA